MAKAPQYARLAQLNVANVIDWQDHPHRVCDRVSEDHLVQLQLCKETISDEGGDKEKRIFHERDCFWTRPIGAALAVKLQRSHSKIEKVEKRRW